MKRCRQCGAEFQEDGTSRKYCCKECAVKAAKNSRIEWNNHNRVYQRAVIKCPLCGREVAPVRIGDTVYQQKIHDDCVVSDIINTVKSGNKLTKLQESRKRRISLTNKQIKELILNAAT